MEPALPHQGLPAQPQPRKDVFDVPDFSAIQLVNQLFPDESSLGELETFADALRTQIRNGDKEIFRAVRTQGGAHARARHELEHGQSQIVDLFQRVTKIQAKAEESETVVQDICRDIRKLDCAKRNLTNSITSMRRLAMLTSAITDLEACAGQHQSYKRAANLVAAVHQLMEHFQQHESVPKVRALANRLSVAESALQQAVVDDFKLLLGTVDVKVSHESLERLSAGCLVADALGPKVRDQLLDWMAEREMKIYQQFTASGGADTSRLDRFEKRFQWFRNRMEEHKAEWGMFPEHWHVPQLLCLMFCKITKAHLKRVLSDGEVQGQADIGPLIKAVVATNKFEKDMATRFGGGSSEDDASEVSTASNTVDAKKRLERLRDQRHQKQIGEGDPQKEAAVGSKAQQEQEAVRTKFEGSISEAFESVLHVYVAEEEREMMAYLEACLREEAERQWKPSEEDMDSKILPSANKVFLKVRSSFTRCVKLISRGQALLLLSEAFKRILRRYSQALLDRLPRTVSGAPVSSVTYPCVGSEWHVRMPRSEEQVVCRILHTAEFCRETLESLSSAITKDIKPTFADKVDMSNEEDSFQALASQCMNALVLGLSTRLDATLQELVHIKWDSIESPGDHSPYVDGICKILVDTAPFLGQELDSTTLSFFCDKAGHVFLPRFHDAINSIKRISDKGALQLSIDCDAILRALLELPKLARAAQQQAGLQDAEAAGEEEEGEASPFSPYCLYIQREMGTINNIMKVVQSKPENLVSTFMLLMPASLQNTVQFTRVCELKGVSRAQQQLLLAEYKQKSPGVSDVSPGGAAMRSFAVNPTPKAVLPDMPNFKINMDNITDNISALASRFGQSNPVAPPQAASREQILLSNAALNPNNPARAAGIGAAADAMANKTKGTFSKMGNVLGTSFAKLKSGIP